MTLYVQHFLWLLFIILIAVVDQWTKQWAIDYYAVWQVPQKWLSFLNIVYVENKGITFGMLSNTGPTVQTMLHFLTILITLALFIWQARSRQWLQRFALCSIIGGACGNLIDRILKGAVIDFIDVHGFGYHWPAFNIADSFICMGVFIIMVRGQQGSHNA